MNILMMEIPTTEKDGSIPFGVLYAASSVYRAGHCVRIIDLVKKPMEYPDLKALIEEFKPAVIGMGGITSSYRACKELAQKIKRDFSGVHIVVGGVLSSVTDLLLERAGVDYVVHGEGEEAFCALIAALEAKANPDTVKGISFLKNGVLHRTSAQPQIAGLDMIGMPEFTLLDMKMYLEPAHEWTRHYFGHDRNEYAAVLDKVGNRKIFFPVITARGCTHRCIFCYRHQKGWRQHSVSYVVNMMRYLRDTYDVEIFQFADELTTGNRAWVIDLCETLIREDLGIAFVVLSSRVDTIDEEMLTLLKKAGCLMINYGYESGSESIIKEIHKGVTIQQALEAGLLTKKVGLKNVPEIIIGFPSETARTVQDTIDFLQKLDTWPISINTPIPFPETALWDIAVKKGLITDKEQFVMGYRRGLFMNFTNYPDRTLSQWVRKVYVATRLHYLKSHGKYSQWLFVFLRYQVASLFGVILSQQAVACLRRFNRDLWRKERSVDYKIGKQ